MTPDSWYYQFSLDFNISYPNETSGSDHVDDDIRWNDTCPVSGCGKCVCVFVGGWVGGNLHAAISTVVN